MNTLPYNPAPERKTLSTAVLAILFGFSFAVLLSAQQAPVRDEFEPADSLHTELDDMHQFLELHLKLGNVSEANRCASQILAKNPGDAEALSALLGYHMKNRNAKQALSYAKRYRAARPGAEADAMYAGALRMNGAKHEALAIMLRRYAKVPKGGHFPHLLELCYCYYDCGKIEQAQGCFRKVQGDKRFSAKMRAEATRELAAIRRDAEIRKAYLAIERRDLKTARTIAEGLVRGMKKPSRDVIALVAVLDADQLNQVGEAVATFEKLKATHKGPEPFPYQATYAVLLLDQGRYAEAEAAAKEAASAKNPLMTAEDARGRLDTLRMIREHSRSTASAVGIFQDQDEGMAYRAKVVASTPFNKKRTRVGAEYQFTDLDFDEAVRGADETDYHAIFGTLSHQVTPLISARLAAGAVAGEFAYRAAIRLTRPSEEDSVEIEVAGGQRPTDTMTLEAFGAHENRITIRANGEVPGHERLRLRGEAFIREIDIDHPLVDELGSGWGARWEAEYLLYQFQRTVVSAAYVGGIDNFDYSSEARAAKNHTATRRSALHVVDDDFHKHGLVVRGRTPLGTDAMAHAELGADYRVDDDELVYSAGGGVEWWITGFTRLNAEATYYTSGVAGNAGSGYLEGRVGASTSF